jgi:hypothetical protein
LEVRRWKKVAMKIHGVKMYEGKSSEKLDAFFYGVFVGTALTMIGLVIITLIMIK